MGPKVTVTRSFEWLKSQQLTMEEEQEHKNKWEGPQQSISSCWVVCQGLAIWVGPGKSIQSYRIKYWSSEQKQNTVFKKGSPRWFQSCGIKAGGDQGKARSLSLYASLRVFSTWKEPTGKVYTTLCWPPQSFFFKGQRRLCLAAGTTADLASFWKEWLDITLIYLAIDTTVLECQMA